MRKQIVIALTCLTFTACTIRPAPMIDLHAPGALGMLTERKAYLKSEQRKLDNVLVWSMIATLSPLMVGGTVYLVQTPARRKIHKELGELSNAEKIIKEMVDHDADAKMEK